MSEFLDFLRHKFAYVAIAEFKPGKFEEAKHLYEKAVSTYAEGFKGAYLLQKPGTDEGIAVNSLICRTGTGDSSLTFKILLSLLWAMFFSAKIKHHKGFPR